MKDESFHPRVLLSSAKSRDLTARGNSPGRQSQGYDSLAIGSWPLALGGTMRLWSELTSAYCCTIEPAQKWRFGNHRLWHLWHSGDSSNDDLPRRRWWAGRWFREWTGRGRGCNAGIWVRGLQMITQTKTKSEVVSIATSALWCLLLTLSGCYTTLPSRLFTLPPLKRP